MALNNSRITVVWTTAGNDSQENLKRSATAVGGLINGQKQADAGSSTPDAHPMELSHANTPVGALGLWPLRLLEAALPLVTIPMHALARGG